jgi:hypothetical protein
MIDERLVNAPIIKLRLAGLLQEQSSTPAASLPPHRCQNIYG